MLQTGRPNMGEAWPFCVPEEWVAPVGAAAVDVGLGT